MTVDGIDYLYLETRNWGRSVRFWQELGFSLAIDLGSSGRLDPPGGGPGIWLEEVSPETPLAQGVYLRLDDPASRPGPPVEIVGEPLTSHWGTRLLTVRDPDGREFILEHTPDGD